MTRRDIKVAPHEDADRSPIDPNVLSLKPRLIGIYALLGALNVGAWIWAIIVFSDKPILLGVALAVYGLGLRHALDADHIAAIDNVTRRLMRNGDRPVSVGFYFALGHSSIVILATALLAGSATVFEQFSRFHFLGGRISTGISATFLIFVACLNMMIFRSILKTWRAGASTGDWDDGEPSSDPKPYGLLARLLRPVLALVSRSWHMFPLGFLFGLGFDTATEVAMFGVSAAHAAKGAPLLVIMVFPVLFAAGMALVDTTDGVMMLGAYDWALLNPRRKAGYNLAITAVSIAVALFIGLLEILSLLKEQLDTSGLVHSVVDKLETRMNLMGMMIVLLFVLCWLVSFAVHQRRAAST